MSNFLNSFIKAGASTDAQTWTNVPQGEPSQNSRFKNQTAPGDTDFTQWVNAMKMVAQLQGGIPPEFRKRLWLQLAERHLASKGVDWSKAERTCFSEWSHPADAELDVQIVKDLHRTGCSLFCGKDGQENQVLLKRVLLAYARWNKTVGYCQGFNMLAALILQVTEKNESDALKLMIYLIEGVLPDSYFAGSLKGLSVDMAVFRELLRTRFPRLSKHLDALQSAAKDGSRSYEPPLTNVFTMQWFLTLFSNCLPQQTVLRVWDLILLEGNEILLRTALAIWQVLSDRILKVRSADEFYCMMGALTRELLEAELVDENVLIKTVVAIRPLTELKTLREHYSYNMTPWEATIPQTMDKQLKLHPKQNIALDISGLKKQYVKLKQRQRQAHIIFSAAISRQSLPAPPVTMNHLLIGKSALMPAKSIGPVPPPRPAAASTLHWKDAPKQSSSSSSSDTELCDEETESSSSDESKPCQFDNLPADGDASLMIHDNTSATVVVEKPEPDPSEFEADNVNLRFDQLLAGHAKQGRRNSDMAMQIIQENSLILHRILQCQTRLSPSPPLLETEESALHSSSEEFEAKHISLQETMGTILSPDGADSASINQPSDKTNSNCFEYGSKYSNILEKSKSLDEKYNTLILNKPVSKTFTELNKEHLNFDKDSIRKSKFVDVSEISEETDTVPASLMSFDFDIGERTSNEYAPQFDQSKINDWKKDYFDVIKASEISPIKTLVATDENNSSRTDINVGNVNKVSSIDSTSGEINYDASRKCYFDDARKDDNVEIETLQNRELIGFEKLYLNSPEDKQVIQSSSNSIFAKEIGLKSSMLFDFEDKDKENSSLSVFNEFSLEHSGTDCAGLKLDSLLPETSFNYPTASEKNSKFLVGSSLDYTSPSTCYDLTATREGAVNKSLLFELPSDSSCSSTSYSFLKSPSSKPGDSSNCYNFLTAREDSVLEKVEDCDTNKQINNFGLENVPALDTFSKFSLSSSRSHISPE
ncbi:unnamed protein product [Phyllotreta striolata]|uniref:TBC1 domain family member 30 n=1 Tax=Phyllotreta striolata TaxID=444603 RepID=A0A9N9TG34_PHYSR|nr:unnamed protein product [Phyllotreta striolata]